MKGSLLFSKQEVSALCFRAKSPVKLLKTLVCSYLNKLESKLDRYQLVFEDGTIISLNLKQKFLGNLF